jgi:hypothetical protein
MQNDESFLGYHHFQSEQDGEVLVHGSFGVFWIGEDEQEDEKGEALPSGFYWWACFPGCLPDSNHHGPFASAKEAYEDAQNG